MRPTQVWLAVLCTIGFALFAVALSSFLVWKAQGAPPDNADRAHAQWFRSLEVPGVGSSCCDLADCRTTDWRTAGNRYEALTPEGWQVVPAETVLHRYDNPTGRAVVCFQPSRGILCFVPGPEA